MNPVANKNKKGTRRAPMDNGATLFRKIACKKCGAVSVDGSKDFVRVLGNPEDYEEIQK